MEVFTGGWLDWNSFTPSPAPTHLVAAPHHLDSRDQETRLWGMWPTNVRASQELPYPRLLALHEESAVSWDLGTKVLNFSEESSRQNSRPGLFQA